MKTINLRDYYPHCREDILVDVSEEVLETILQAVRTEHTQERKPAAGEPATTPWIPATGWNGNT